MIRHANASDLLTTAQLHADNGRATGAQGRGIGRRLLYDCAATLQAQGRSGLTLMVLEGNSGARAM